jgi:hypothetical protein
MIKSRRIWAGHVEHTGETRNWYKIVVWKPEGKTPLGRPRSRWEDNIKIYLRKIGFGGSGQGPVAGCYEHGNKPLGSIKCGEFLG